MHKLLMKRNLINQYHFTEHRIPTYALPFCSNYKGKATLPPEIFPTSLLVVIVKILPVLSQLTLSTFDNLINLLGQRWVNRFRLVSRQNLFHLLMDTLSH